VEENPDYFLDTSFNHQEGNFTTRVYQKSGKLQDGSAILFYVPYIEQNDSPNFKQKPKPSNSHSTQQETTRNWQVTSSVILKARKATK